MSRPVLAHREVAGRECATSAPAQEQIAREYDCAGPAVPRALASSLIKEHFVLRGELTTLHEALVWHAVDVEVGVAGAPRGQRAHARALPQALQRVPGPDVRAVAAIIDHAGRGARLAWRPGQEGQPPGRTPMDCCAPSWTAVTDGKLPANPCTIRGAGTSKRSRKVRPADAGRAGAPGGRHARALQADDIAGRVVRAAIRLK